MNTARLISIISSVARRARELEALHEQGIIYGPLIPSCLSADGSLLSPVPLNHSQTIDLERIAHSPQETLSRNAAPGTASDLYSLGVLLYRQLAGQLPFSVQDPLKLVHEIFTSQPQPPHEIRTDIPLPFSLLTMALLAKSADERPQSAGEIAVLLETFVECLQNGEALPEFTPREQEHRLNPKSRLFGRDAEIAGIRTMVDEVKGGRFITAAITGPSGIGKSRLISSARPLVAEHNGLFASGKYNQFKRNIPYSAIIEVFQDLFRQLLSLASGDLELWRRDLLAALGDEGKVVSDVIPDILHITGPFPPIPVLSGMAAQLRFNGVFSRLLSVFAKPAHPLVVFLDDLQWIDAASLALIEATGVMQTGSALLFLGAYRDNEVTDTHPLLHTLGTLEKAGVDSRLLALAPLEDSDIHQIVLEACDHRILDSQELSARVMQETCGNPFFTRQYLEELYNDGLLHFNPKLDSWMWAQSDEALPQTTDVMDLMRRRLARHSKETCDLLHIGACIGTKFYLAQLEKITGLQDYEVLAALEPAIASGLILPADEAAGLNVWFSFLHDRVQQVAYGLKTKEENTAVHLTIAQKLRHGLDDRELDLQLFDIVDQFNQGLALISSKEDRFELAGLNRLAGVKAFEALAFAAAIAYFDTALTLLGEESWQTHHELCFTIGMLNLETRYQLPGSGFETFADILEAYAGTKPEIVKIDLLRIKQSMRLSLVMESLEQARVSLERLGIRIPATTADADTLEKFCMSELARFKECMKHRTFDDLYALPDTEDETIGPVLDILAEITAPAIGFNFLFFAGIHCLGTTLSIRNGMNPSSAIHFNSVSSVLIVFDRDYAGASHLSQIAEKLAAERYSNSTLLQLVITGQHILTAHWIKPFPINRTRGLENGELAARVHDPLFKAWNFQFVNLMQFDHGKNLLQAGEDAQNLYRFSAANQFDHAMQLGQLYKRIACLFTSSAGVPESFSDAEFNEEAFIETWRIEAPQWVGNLHMGQAIFHAFARRPENLLAAVTAAQLVYPPLFPMNDAMSLWTALAWHALARTGSPEQQTEASANIQQSLDFFKKIYADGGEFNTGHRIQTIEALQADLAGDFAQAKHHFGQAILLAKTNEFNMDCGLIAEIASECLAETDRPYSLQCLRQARQAYSAAQALALVNRIEASALYPLVLEEDAKKDALTNLDAIDAMTVTRAVMALSGEVEFKNLLPRLLTIILEHSGAERACLVSRKEGKIRIEQVAGEMTLTSPIPEGLLNFVINTRESIYFDKIGTTGFPTDPYFDSGEIKSVACRVLDKKKPESMALYLENKAVACVFSENRREVLNWIISQAAVSVATAAAYEALRISRERFELAVTGTNDGIYDVDLITDTWYVSPRYLSMLGLGEEEFPNGLSSFEALLHPDDHDPAMVYLHETFTGTNDFLDLECRLRHRDGSYIWILSRGKILRDASGKAVRFSGSHTDITERKRAEAELEQARITADEARVAAESANQAKSNLLANMSHELRTPLNAILGYAQILKRKKSNDAEVVEGLDIIQHSGDHLLTLINYILDQSRTANGMQDLEAAAVNLTEFLRQILGITESRAEAKGLSLEYEPLSALPAGVMADEARLRQVLLNLLDNAVKFTDQGRIRLTLGVVPDEAPAGQEQVCLRFSIEDTGVGISQADLGSVFQPFEQVGDRSKQSEGTGMGLTISRQIVEKMGGRLLVESEEEKGSRFWFNVTLPTVAKEVSTISMARLIEGYYGPRRRALVVDDKLYNRQMLGALLASLGFEVDTAAQGQKAVEQSLAKRPDVILMDLLMPVMTGVEAVQQIRREKALQQVVVIGVSAGELETEQEQSLSAGCNAFLPKPVQVLDLCTLLADHLDLKWQYAGNAEESSAPLVMPGQQILATLRALADLHDYAGLEENLARLGQEDTQYQPFVHQIREWARSFDMQSIQRFLKERRKNRRDRRQV